MLTIEYAKNPIWVNEENTIINLIVKFYEMTDELPFTANPNDYEPYSKELFDNAVAGVYGEVKPYIPPTPNQTA